MAIYYICAVVFISTVLTDTSRCAESGLDTSAQMRHAVQGQIKNTNLKKLVESVSYLTSLPDRMSNKNQWEAARWVEKQFRQYGLNTSVQTYEYQNETWPNVIGEINATSRTNQYILILAHLDSLSRTPNTPAPGADDDGSGLAVLLETARVLSPVAARHNIVFIAFSNEESSQQGSTHYVRHLNPEMKIIGVINLDVLGYNKPDELFYPDALACHSTLKYKIKAAYRMTKNYLLGSWYGRDAVKIVGQPANKDLVAAIDSAVRGYTDIGTKIVVGDDCG